MSINGIKESGIHHHGQRKGVESSIAGIIQVPGFGPLLDNADHVWEPGVNQR